MRVLGRPPDTEPTAHGRLVPSVGLSLAPTKRSGLGMPTEAGHRREHGKAPEREIFWGPRAVGREPRLEL